MALIAFVVDKVSRLSVQTLGISKRGDPFVRIQLIHGARALDGIAERRDNFVKVLQALGFNLL